MPEAEAQNGAQGVQVLSPEQIQELVRGDAPSGQGFDVPEIQTVPVILHLIDGANSFVVSNYNSWAFTKHGVFATGEWDGEGDEQDLLFPYTSIFFIEYDFGDLEKALNNKADGSSDESDVSAEGESDDSQDGESSSN